MEFEQALKLMKQGGRACRKSWNGKGIFAALHRPKEGDLLTFPYLFFDNSGLCNNPDGFRLRVPWIPSMSDLLMDDWQEFEQNAPD